MGVRSHNVGLHLDRGAHGGFARVLALPFRGVIVGAIGTHTWHRGVGKSHSAAKEKRAHPTSTPELEKFKKELVAMQVAARVAKGKVAVIELDEKQLGKVPGGKVMRIDVAERFNQMWGALEPAFNARDGAKDKDRITVASAYRSAEDDEKAWQNAFPKYYWNTLDDRLATGNEFGHEALIKIFHYMNGKKAPAGFSGHTHGIAADLAVKENGASWTVNSDPAHQAGWQKIWTYKWLCENAARYGFYQLKTETWHWEWHATEANALLYNCWRGSLPPSGRPVPKS